MSIIVSTKIINAERFKESTPYPITYVIRRVNDEQNRRWYHYQEDANDRSKWFASVTEIIKANPAPQLAEYKTRTSLKKQATVLEDARELGERLHQLIETDLMNKPVEIPPRLSKAFQEWQRLRKQHEIHAIVLELPVVSDSCGFGGTIDALGTFNGKPCIMDFKSSRGYHKEAGWQMSAYRTAYQEMTGRKDIGIVGLHIPREPSERNRGNAFVYEHYDWTTKSFMSCFHLWKDRNWKYLEKWGWRWLKK